MPDLSTLPIETLLIVRELESGQVLTQPVAHPAYAAYDDETEALVAMELFLTELLRREGAEAQATFSLPQKDITLTHVEVPLPKSEEKVGRALSYAMPCVVLPHRKSRWVLVLPLSMTVHVGRGEDLDEVVASEATRLLAALQPSAHERLSYFCAQTTRLERLQLSIERRASVDGGTKALRAKLDRGAKQRLALKTLKTVGQQIYAADVRGPEPVAAQDPLETLTALLGTQERRSIVLVGDESVGKTTLVRTWLRHHPDRWLFATSAAQLIAGMGSLGQWQERVKRVMEAAETLDAVLWLDDLRDLLGDRSGTFDLASAIRPWLDGGRVRLVGELTPDAADIFATRQAGLFAAMHPVRVAGHGPKEARTALRACVEHAAKHEPDRPGLAMEAIDTVVELTDRFVPYRPFPGKAVQLFEELRSAAERKHSAERQTLGRDAVYEAFSRMTGVPSFLLRDDRAWRTERAQEQLARRIVGQSEAVRRVVEALAVIKAGLAPGDKPLASLLFVGPTGVGKTSLARALAELLFGSATRLARFDMSELSDASAAERLLSGVDGNEGRLTSTVRQQPFSVILLDEIEKAHPSVFDLLLGVLGEGRLTDARGRTAYFHNAIVIMTSNLGTRRRARALGIDPARVDDGARFSQAVDEHFRPEFVNRIDAIVPFAALSRAEIREVAEHAARSIALRPGLMELGVSLSVTEAALDRLTAEGYDAEFGARAMRRELEDGLVAPVARALGPMGAAARSSRVLCRAPDEPGLGGASLVSERHGAIVIEVGRSDTDAQDAGLGTLEVIAKRRRWVRSQLALPSVEERRERHNYLLAELSYGKDRKARTPDGSDPKELTFGQAQAELHELREHLAELDAAVELLSDIEELVLAAALAGEAGDEMLAEARTAELAFRQALLALLLCDDPRHHCVVLAREQDKERPLDVWLGQLLEALPRLGWRLVAHVRPDRGPRPAVWPRERVWGPSRTAEELAALLRKDNREPMAVILRISGLNAGTLMALETGLHRHVEPRPKVPFSTFLVRTLSVKRSTLDDKELDQPCAQLGPIPNPLERKLMAAAREVHQSKVRIDEGADEIDLERHEYWAHIEAIALTHLLFLERSLVGRAALFSSPLDETDEDEQSEV